MNIDSLSGYEFEELVCNLLRKMGLDAEQTPLSGDGGVDIIAYSNEPLFRGKYLIQCKRYSSSVGEPVIRDLYGTVLSQNATKGIVVTNSFFTKQATSFADGKIIELIDGDELGKLLCKYGLDTNNTEGRVDCDYTQYLGDNVGKYEILREIMAQNKKAIKPHLDLFGLLYACLTNNLEDTTIFPLVKECQELSDKIERRFGKNKKFISEIYRQQNVSWFLELLSGNIYEFVKGVIFSNHFTVSVTWADGILFSPAHYTCAYSPLENVIYLEDGSTPEIVLRNMLVLFLRLNYSEGVSLLVEKFINASENIANDHLLWNSEAQREKNKELFEVQLDRILKNEDCRIFVPSIREKYIYSERQHIDISTIVDRWPNDIDIATQLKEVSVLLQT